jgi:alanine dehydrogenase
MRLAIPKEIKDHEYRVALTPAGARQLVSQGHEVRVQSGAGARIGFADDAYAAAGARVVDSLRDLYDVDLVFKVKEPQPQELPWFKPGQMLFCYLHLAAARELANVLLERKVSAIAFETVTDARGDTVLLKPMSEIAGRLAPLMGARGLEMAHGGSGLLVCGAPGVPGAHIVILGGGTVGMNAARIAVGLGARVAVLDRKADKLRRFEELFGARVETGFATPERIETAVTEADIVIGAAMIAGRHAPRLIDRALLARMRPGAVLVDVAIDQGGISETSRPTSHSDPFYVEQGIVHYCVANMPGAVARTATEALAHATLPYLEALAGQGLAALDADPGLRAGLQLHNGAVTHAGLAEDLEHRND